MEVYKCSYTELVPIKDLKPHPRNPNDIQYEIPWLEGCTITKNGDVFRYGKPKAKIRGGYKKRYLRLSVDNKHYLIHRLVLQVFVGGCPNGMQACHNNGNPRDNRLENLRWDTPINNSRDKINHGTSGVGEMNAMAKITNQQAEVIIKTYPLVKCSGYDLPISSKSVSGIATGRIRFNPDFNIYYAVNKEIAKMRIKQGLKYAN